MDPKIDAVKTAISLGDSIHRKVNSRRGWSANAQKGLEREVREVLRIVLEREPTSAEVKEAASD